MKAMEGCYRLQKVVCDILFFWYRKDKCLLEAYPGLLYCYEKLLDS